MKSSSQARKVEDLTVKIDLSKVYEKCQNLITEKAVILLPDDIQSSSKIRELYKDKQVVLDLSTQDAVQRYSMGYSGSEANTSIKIEDIIAEKEKENQNLAKQIQLLT